MRIRLCYELYRRRRASFGWNGVISEWLLLEWVGLGGQVCIRLCYGLHFPLYRRRRSSFW